MAELLDILRESISSEYVSQDQCKMIEDIMEGKRTRTMCCQILSKPRQEYLLCKFDCKGGNNRLFPFFNPKVAGLVSMCDYFLFLEESTRLIILLLELKSSSCPKSQLEISESFGQFLQARLQSIFPAFKSKQILIKKIGIKESYNYKHGPQGFVYSFDEKGYALLPNPKKLFLAMVSDSCH